MVSIRVACSSRPGSTNLGVVKLVEPTCDEGAGRVETVVTLPGDLWPDLFSTRPFPVADGGSRPLQHDSPGRIVVFRGFADGQPPRLIGREEKPCRPSDAGD